MKLVASEASQEFLPLLPADAPLRSELLGDDHLAELARRLAGDWTVRVRPGPHPLLRRLRENEIVLRLAHESAAAAAARSEPLMPDAEWLLDNFYVIEDVLREVRTDLPGGYYDELPVIVTGGPVGQPRVYELAVTLVAHTDSHLAEAQVLRYVNAFQEIAPPTIGELWPVPIMLRLALLENLRRLGDQMLAARAARTGHHRGAGRPHAPEHPSDAFLVAPARPSRPSDTPDDWRLIGRHEMADLAGVLRREHRRRAGTRCRSATAYQSAAVERGGLVGPVRAGQPGRGGWVEPTGSTPGRVRDPGPLPRPSNISPRPPTATLEVARRPSPGHRGR